MKMFAGIPYSLPVTSPVVGKEYYAAIDAELRKVRYLGVDGDFDRRPVHVYEWLAGPMKGKQGRSYSQSFWRLPTRRERKQMWREMGAFEQEKLLAGGYAGLKAEWFYK